MMEARLLAARRMGELVPPEQGKRKDLSEERTGYDIPKQRLSDFRKLWIAREVLSIPPQKAAIKHGTNVPRFTWEKYCQDIGIEKRTEKGKAIDGEFRGVDSPSYRQIEKQTGRDKNSLKKVCTLIYTPSNVAQIPCLRQRHDSHQT